MARIEAAEFPAHLALVQDLFREYAAGLSVDLSFQGFDSEVAGLPGKYAPPRGRLLLAWEGTAPVGCVALRPVDEAACEMKRLYVRPAARRARLGRRLARRVCAEARTAGYRRILLDTLPTMTAALALYASMGFHPVEPYVHNPIRGARFLGLDL